MADLVFTEVRKQSRVYHFPAGTFRVEGVVRFASPGSTHRLETEDGRKFIVSGGWLAIEIEVDQWTA